MSSESPLLMTTPNTNVHETHCRGLVEELSQREQLLHERLDELLSSQGVPGSAMGQMSMGNALPQQVLEEASKMAKETVGMLSYLAEWNCRRLATHSTQSLTAAGGYDENPLAALLAFVMHATPDEELAQSISTSPSGYLDTMSLTFAHHLTNENTPASTVFEVEGVPDATDKVKGRMAWVQVPKASGDGEMGLELVWKVRIFVMLNTSNC